MLNKLPVRGMFIGNNAVNACFTPIIESFGNENETDYKIR